MAKISTRPSHDRSICLTEKENDDLIRNIEHTNGVTIATAIARLWLSEKPDHINWYKSHKGIVCFVKDYSKKSYFFRIYGRKGILLWEQELPFSYNRSSNNFHYFKADECNAGFNFSKEKEAQKFYETVTNKIDKISNKKHANLIDLNQLNNFKNKIINSRSKLKALTEDEMTRVEQVLSRLKMPVNKQNIEIVYLFIKTNGGMNSFEEELNKTNLESFDVPSQQSNLDILTNLPTRKHRPAPAIPIQRPPPIPPRSKHTNSSSNPDFSVNQSVESSALPQPYLESSESAILPEKISSSSEQLVASSNHLDQRTKLLNDIKNGTHLSHVQRLSDTSSPKTSNNLSIYDELKNIIIKRGEIMNGKNGSDNADEWK